MNLTEQLIDALEKKRAALNQRLMEAETVADANEIERELWGLRAAISHYKSSARKKRSSGASKAGN